MGTETDFALQITPSTDVLTGLEKSLPAVTRGRTVAEFLAGRPRLSDCHTPLLTVDADAVTNNLTRMAVWCAERGLDLAPHGKTTMAPALWERQLNAGAWGITLANPAQLRIALRAGVPRVQLANTLVDPGSITELARALDADPDLTVHTWVDSVEAVTLLATVLGSGSRRQYTVLLELGAPGGRTGARDLATALAVADAVVATPQLRLGGVCGYEGALAHDRCERGLAAVRTYLADLAGLHRELRATGRYPDGEIVVSAGGSAYFDEVADVLGPLAGADTRVVLRSGAYLIHDDGFYQGISPLDGTLRSAMHGWARVVSRPEPGLALLDAGKRDLPYDEGLPRPQLVADRLGGPTRPLDGEITSVNDQHAFLRIEPATALRVGDVVRLGLSHPCTAFDKWRWIPVVAHAPGPGTEDDPLITDLVQTYF
ncbi:amino acid deaminase [Pseudonocardia spinosispora]|uniref:amino acid deaminase n=1 Tax=Pseudonocardia spinosispora TaxID=103441 RepID=UPI00040C7317|nr:amino acid deaminase [Pseudonocardia spinosispora]